LFRRLCFAVFFVYSQLAAGGAAPWTSIPQLFTDPVVALFGLAALSVIFGKHTDKIATSKKRTLPKVLGFPAATYACAATIVAPHLVLAWTLFQQRLWPLISASSSSSTATALTIPWGAALGFLTLLREAPLALKVLAKGAPTPPPPTTTTTTTTAVAAETTSSSSSNGTNTQQQSRPPLWARGKIFRGTLINANVNQAWPLWFVAFCGWHALTFTYLVVIGSGLEWAWRVAAVNAPRALGLFVS
jgi:hypothetical protein